MENEEFESEEFDDFEDAEPTRDLVVPGEILTGNERSSNDWEKYGK